MYVTYGNAPKDRLSLEIGSRVRLRWYLFGLGYLIWGLHSVFFPVTFKTSFCNIPWCPFLWVPQKRLHFSNHILAHALCSCKCQAALPSLLHSRELDLGSTSLLLCHLGTCQVWALWFQFLSSLPFILPTPADSIFLCQERPTWPICIVEFSTSQIITRLYHSLGIV